MRAIRQLVEQLFNRRPAEITPTSDDYLLEANDTFRALYPGRSADIFFENDGRLIHKWLHYFAVYDQLFERYVGTDVKMLEIGVFKGGSLGLWRRFFGEKAVIYGVDIDPTCAAFNGESAQVRIGSQDDPDFLRNVVAEMGGVDIVLDDGSHIAAHQRASFDALFPLLSEGGLYLIEDMCTAYWPPYDGGLKKPGTAVEFLKDKIDDMHKHYIDRSLNTPESLSNIESIQFFDSIAAIRKHKQLPRANMQIPAARPDL